MPPPPPPSKSYLLVFDSDSSDDSEDEYRRRHDYFRSCNSTNSNSELLDVAKDPNGKVKSDSPKPPTIQNDQGHQNGSGTKLSKSQKKRQKRKKKKNAAKQHIEKQETVKGVSFSAVSIREYPRAFSMDTVPAHGGWPLGMSLDGYEDLDQIEVDEYETTKQERLHERWMDILSARDKSPPGSPSSPSKKKKDHNKVVDHVKVVDDQIIRMIDANATCIDNCCAAEKGDSTPPENIIYESRQWDYKSRIKNPLFGAVSEDERHAMLLEASDGNSTSLTDSRHHIDHSSKHRARSNSIGNHKTNGCNGQSRRSRSNSIGNHDLGNTIKGKFNDEYNQSMVHHVRNELEQLRIDRSKSGATGCNCRKLVVYLPPKDGSGGKKAQHRRLKPSKVVQELKKRHLYDSALAKSTREEMEKVLHDAVEKEPCCSSSDCFCVRNGLICQADACSCWHDSHVHVKHGDREPLSNADIRKRCGNPSGMYLVDTDAIEDYRIKILTAMKQTEG